ncbi:MAG TPA: hypothetical protein VK209_12100 [Candidatus Sulfotelmatobacter sp.]|nr:hypothetical protein [Candidatus Sulfotelmatobacter sp.]
MSYPSEDFWRQLNHVVNVIPKRYVDALLFLHEKFDDKNINWIISGDLAESLRVVDVQPNCIEIVSSKEDAERIFQAVQEFEPQQGSIQIQKLDRNAIVGGKEYPVYTKSYYFDFNLNTVKVKVQGDLQFKVNDWDWGDIFEFTPEYVYIVGKKTAVVPLSIAYELYQNLGWTDRAEKVRAILQRRRAQRPSA